MNDADIFNRRFLAYFAAFLAVSAMAYVAAITFLNVPKDNTQYASTALGFILGTVMATPIAFYFGSSKSSQAKDERMREPPTDPSGTPIVKVDDSKPVAVKEVAA